jgi:hypothetical protein
MFIRWLFSVNLPILFLTLIYEENVPGCGTAVEGVQRHAHRVLGVLAAKHCPHLPREAAQKV